MKLFSIGFPQKIQKMHHQNYQFIPMLPYGNNKIPKENQLNLPTSQCPVQYKLNNKLKNHTKILRSQHH